MEALGAFVEWEPETKTVSAFKTGFEFRHTIGTWYAYANGKLIKFDDPSVNRNGVTMVPVRAISDSFGAKIDWNDTSRVVTVTY